VGSGGSARAWCDKKFRNCRFAAALLGGEGIRCGYEFFKFVGLHYTFRFCHIYSLVNRRIYSDYVHRFQIHFSISIPRNIV
jgi:hypothetical protein